MPRSPLTLLLMALTLVAFAAYLVCLLADQWRSPMFLSAGMLLAIATTASIVHDGGAFDSRAFHRTRPRGETKAFRNSSLRLAGLATGVAIMGLIFVLVLNLRWFHGAYFALTLGLPVWFCVAAFAVGLTLVLSSESRPMVTILLLVLPPVVMSGLLSEIILGPSPSVRDYLWTYAFIPTWAPLLGAAGYSLAWWLAARCRRRDAALLLACLTGTYLPIGQRLGSLPVPEPPPMPELALEVTRVTPAGPNPIEEKIRKLFREDNAKTAIQYPRQDEQTPHYVPIFLGGRLHVKGLREDEFVWAQRLVPYDKGDSYPPAVRVSQGSFQTEYDSAMETAGNDTFILHGDPSQERTGERSLIDYLNRQLPAPSHLAEGWFIDPPERRGLDWISVDEKRTSIAAMEARDWRLDGVVYRMEEAGSFEVSRGGWFRCPSGGTVVVSPFPEEDHPTRIRCRMIDAPRFMDGDPGWSRQALPAFPTALVRDPVSGETRVLEVESDNGRNAMVWRNFRIRIAEGSDEDDPKLQAQVRRSRLYLFKAVPQGRVNMTLPPPPPAPPR